MSFVTTGFQTEQKSPWDWRGRFQWWPKNALVLLICPQNKVLGGRSHQTLATGGTWGMWAQELWNPSGVVVRNTLKDVCWQKVWTWIFNECLEFQWACHSQVEVVLSRHEENSCCLSLCSLFIWVWCSKLIMRCQKDRDFSLARQTQGRIRELDQQIVIVEIKAEMIFMKKITGDKI